MHRRVLTFCRVALATASLCWVLGCASQAGAPAKRATAPAQEPVRVYGAERDFAVLENEGRAVPLRQAVEHLVPTDYAVRWIDVDAARRNAPVTWNAKQAWPAAIRQAITAAPGLTVDIATGSRLVLIRQVSVGLRPPRPVSPAQPAASAPAAVPARTVTAVPAVTSTAVLIKPVASASTPPVAARKNRLDGMDPAAAPAVVPASRRWGLSEQDRTLKLAIERWALEAGWRVFWELGVDYPIAATASIGGSFEEAVSVVVRSMEHADVPPKAIFYRGNQVLRMVPRGME